MFIIEMTFLNSKTRTPSILFVEGKGFLFTKKTQINERLKMFYYWIFNWQRNYYINIGELESVKMIKEKEIHIPYDQAISFDN